MYSCKHARKMAKLHNFNEIRNSETRRRIPMFESKAYLVVRYLSALLGKHNVLPTVHTSVYEYVYMHVAFH